MSHEMRRERDGAEPVVRGKRWAAPTVLLALLGPMANPTPARAAERAQPPAATAPDDSARAKAEAHYRAGLSLFEAGNREQALVEFKLAHEALPSADAVFMMAQSEYHLGQLREAREHYEQYLASQANGPLAATARLRIEAIDRRPSVLAISSEPDTVDVRIEGEGREFTGQAPAEFKIPRGHYRVTVSKPNHVTGVREVDLGIADARTLFFKLEPIPARLEIRTRPSNAALYVRGARSLNPYAQDVQPGAYEIYAEATDYRPRREVLTLLPGERRTVDFALPYVQRSGRPELIWFWTAVGGVSAATGYLALLSGPERAKVTSLSYIAAAGAVGAIAAGLLATAFVPDYIPDNRAMFRIGLLWTGAAQGASLALALDREPARLGVAWLGGAAGLVAGSVAGIALESKSPNYGRATLIQSATAAGLLAGVLAVPAFGLYSHEDYVDDTTTTEKRAYGNSYGRAAFVGVNVGLAAGLAAAYLPDQRQYGPSWKRIVLIDLAAAAGTVTGVLGAAIGECLANSDAACDLPDAQPTSQLALLGGGLGFLAGLVLTRGVDRREPQTPAPTGAPVVPVPTALVVSGNDGRTAVVPGLAAQGRF